MEELLYDIYFKFTDIKFWYDCLDDNEKLKIKLIILFSIIIVSFTCLYYIS